nr:8984_t:CDS:2 [Entrophospora candida]
MEININTSNFTLQELQNQVIELKAELEKITRPSNQHIKDEGRKIEEAIHRLKGTSIAQLEPARQNQNHKVKTIDGITKLFYFEWPIEGDYAGFMRAQCLPHIGEFLWFSPLETTSINKPSPLISSHSIPENSGILHCFMFKVKSKR